MKPKKILELEKAFGFELKQVPFDKIQDWRNSKSYSIDKNQYIVGINLDDTKVDDVSVLSGLVNLQRLSLSYTQVTDVSVLSGLVNLQSLYLSSTQVTDVSVLSGLVNLQRLSLSYTQVTDVPVLSGLVNLQSLDLSSTQVTDVSSLLSLKSLKYLDCSNTLIDRKDSIEYILEHLPNLISVSFVNTPVPIDSSLLYDVKGLRALFKDAKNGVTEKRNTKLLFLGDGCVGKSTLLAHLKALEIPEDIPIDQRTEGIELDIWKDVLPNMKVNVWDFGGQEVMHSTHRLFLGERAIYVLVWCKESKKKCSGEENHDLQYWLDFIADYGRQSIVLLVENVIDNEFDQKEFPDHSELEDLVKKYKERKIELIPTRHRFDVKNNTDEVESFRDTIKNKIKSLHRKFPIEDYPESWYIFQERLEQEKETHKTITIDKYVELGKESDVSDPKDLLSFFDKTGVIGYYENLSNDTVVLQTSWILDAVYATVRLKDNLLIRTKGKLIDQDFELVWSNYSEEEQLLFKEYMLKSNLLSKPTGYSSKVRDYQYLCPALFEDKSIDTILWEEKEQFVVVQFNFMFGAIMQQLQVRALNHCHYEEEEVFYKNYVCFKDKENQLVWVEMFPKMKELRIFSQSEKSIQVVLNELNEIYPLERTKLSLRKKEGHHEEFIFRESEEEFFDSPSTIEKEGILKREEEMEEEKPIKVFVTYSWSDGEGNFDKEHQDRVGRFTSQLITEWSIDATFDLMEEEDNFIKMMYSNLYKNDKVIIVLSEGYAKKASQFKESGVSDEYERVINDIKKSSKKYILVTFDKRGDEKVPFGFQGNDVIVLKEDLKEENLTDAQNRLLSKLTDDPIVDKPKLSGRRPKVRKRKF